MINLGLGLVDIVNPCHFVDILVLEEGRPNLQIVHSTEVNKAVAVLQKQEGPGLLNANIR